MSKRKEGEWGVLEDDTVERYGLSNSIIITCTLSELAAKKWLCRENSIAIMRHVSLAYIKLIQTFSQVPCPLMAAPNPVNSRLSIIHSCMYDAYVPTRPRIFPPRYVVSNSSLNTAATGGSVNCSQPTRTPALWDSGGV